MENSTLNQITRETLYLVLALLIVGVVLTVVCLGYLHNSSKADNGPWYAEKDLAYGGEVYIRHGSTYHDADTGEKILEINKPTGQASCDIFVDDDGTVVIKY